METMESQKPMSERVSAMLAASRFAVVGASTNTEKFGYRVWRRLRDAGRTAWPVNPRASAIDGEPCYATLADLPEIPDVVVSIVPPAITESLVPELARLGVKNLWMQPGAESAQAIARAEAAGIATVYGGPCFLVLLRPA